MAATTTLYRREHPLKKELADRHVQQVLFMVTPRQYEAMIEEAEALGFHTISNYIRSKLGLPIYSGLKPK